MNFNDIPQLVEIKDKILAALTKVEFHPDSEVKDRKFNWNEYRHNLIEDLISINKLIDDLQTSPSVVGFSNA